MAARDRIDTEPELLQLFRSEFGVPAEVWIRFALILAGGLGYYLYTGGWIGPLWSVAYLISQGLTYLALTRRAPPYRTIDLSIGYAAYMLTTATFAAMPAYLLTLDNVTLAFCGAMGLIALGVFTLWREEPPGALLIFDIGMGVFAAGLALAHYLTYTSSVLERVLMIMLCGTALGYYAMALVATRAMRVRLKTAARRGIEAQKMEAIGRLSGGVAHDFNNILTVLQGNLELYDEIEQEDERRKLIADAHVATQRAAGLVAQLLAFARRAPLAPSTIEAKAVIEELTSMIARLLPASITVYPATPTELTFVRADRDQLLSALLNLVINARDAMQGQGEITIAATNRAVNLARPVEGLSPGRYVSFSVTDNGPGMSAETAEHALEPFFSTKPVGEGSGLGLPTAKGFAEQSGGALVIKSGRDGTTVTIHLPRADFAPV